MEVISVNTYERITKIGEWARSNAVDCIFPFWTSEFIMDSENGGFYGKVTIDMQRDNTEPRGLTLTGRMLYAFSAAYRTFGDPVYLDRATYTFKDMVKRFYDKEFGGAYTTVTALGEVLADDKPNYCEAFLVMGCAEYYHASGDKEALRIAMETFDIMETKVKTAPGCYRSNVNRKWEPTSRSRFGSKGGRSFPEGAVMFPHHLCQAYLRLYQATGNEAVGNSLRDMVEFVSDKLYDTEYHCFKSMIDKDGNRIGTNQSFGHDCEISYLIINSAELVGDESLQNKVRTVVVDILNHVRDNDFDPYGSLYNGGDLVTGVRQPIHVWWAQAESVSAMLCGFHLTGDDRFLAACERQISFIDKYFVNRENGDWYNNILVDEDGGRVVDGSHGFDKLNGGKCPFHNSQMCFEVIDRTTRMLKEGKN